MASQYMTVRVLLLLYLDLTISWVRSDTNKCGSNTWTQILCSGIEIEIFDI